MPRLLPLQRELFRLMLSNAIYTAATALVGIFVPLIILHSGGNLVLVAAFYFGYAVIKLVLNYPLMVLIQRYGTHRAIAVGYVAGATQMLAMLMYASSREPAALALAALALAVTNACLWNAQHLHVSRVINDQTRSSSMATMEITRKFVGVFAPIIGGVAAAMIGPSWVLAAALILAAAAGLPLIGLPPDSPAQPAIAPAIKYSLHYAPGRDLWANFCFNIDTVIGVMVWPMYLAVVVASYQGIGYISALAATAAIITTWLAGHLGDRGHDRGVLRQGVTASSLVHLLRLLAVTPITTSLLTAGYQSALAYFQNAWASTYYAHTKRYGVNYVMSMEIACDAAYVGLWGLLLVLLITASAAVAFGTCFTVAALATWGCLLITRPPRQSAPLPISPSAQS